MENTERAKVRWVDIVPTMHNGMEMFLIRDPEGLAGDSLLVSRDVLFLISLMDGKKTVLDIQEAYMRASGGALVPADRIISVMEAMDAQFLLQNDRYEGHVAALKDAYAALSCRTAFLAGRSYPDDEAGLRAFMEGMLRQGRAPAGKDHVKGIIAPHIDYGRGADVYRRAYRFLPVDENTLFVIFGTCHKPAPRVWNIALRDLRTPLGTVKGAAEVGRLLREDALLGAYVDEWPHRNEHSIELQLPIIQSLLGHGRFEVLSILTGSFHEYMEAGRSPSLGEAAELAERLKEILKAHEGPCVVIAGADLAHIGAQFGDPPPLDASTLEESRQKDGALLETVVRVDAAGFFEAVCGEGDRRRICGLAPIYFLLSMLDPCGGEVVGYDQWTDGASSVSFAGVVFS
jgi:AmmeMemoRadiSam system protein B